MTDLSLVIPVYNEEENLCLLFDAIQEALKPIERSWEVIFVDDGSSDKSLNVLESLSEKDSEHVRVVILRRNFGQTAAISAGVDYAQGKIIILLDADLQNDPADIPLLLTKLDEGYDLVSGWRKDRKDNRLTRTIPSNLANGLISWVTGVHLHDYGCTLKAYRREALEGFRLYGEMHRFIPVFAHSIGARITELPVRHHPRKFGEAKYGLDRTVKVILDLFTVKFLLDYSHKPMRLFGGAGMVLISGSGILLLYLFMRRLLDNVPVLGSPLFQLGVMFFILGFQSILMGLIAELLARTYHESQAKPTYTILKTYNIKSRQ
jgi:glycosyltransferase involved in cell wall biosynthesis